MIRNDLWCPVCRGKLRISKVKVERVDGDHNRRCLWCPKCRMAIRIMRVHGKTRRNKPSCRAEYEGHSSCHLVLGHTGPHEDMHGRNWKVVSV